MTMKLLSVWGRVERPWGYEVRADFVDEAGAIFNEVLTFPSEPSASELDAAVAARLIQVEGRVAAEALVVPEPTREDLARKVADLTGAQINYLPNPRKEAIENDLIVDNRCFIEMGLKPTTLDDGLLSEVVDVARRWADRPLEECLHEGAVGS
jgi:hypothetical protein